MYTIWQEIQAVDTSRKALRSFGWLVGAVLLGIGVFMLWRKDWTATTAVSIVGGLGALLVLSGTLAPAILKPIYRVWMALAVVLGFVMTRVILTLVYFLVLTPIGLVLRLFGKDLLDRKLDPRADSYWKRKEYLDDSPARLEKYY